MLERITLDELRRFLLDPVDQSAKKQLGPVQQDPLRTLHCEADEEPLFAEFPVGWHITTAAVNRVVTTSFLESLTSVTQSDMAIVLDHLYDRYARQNKVPPEPFATADKSVLLAAIYETGTNAQKLLATISRGAVKYRRFVLGEGLFHDGEAIDPAHCLTGPAAVLDFQKEEGCRLKRYNIEWISGLHLARA